MKLFPESWVSGAVATGITLFSKESLDNLARLGCVRTYTTKGGQVRWNRTDLQKITDASRRLHGN